MEKNSAKPVESAGSNQIISVPELLLPVEQLQSMFATCGVGRTATLNEFNVKHYRVVPGLSLARPYAR